MTKEEKAVLWAERIQEFRSSGQTCKEWCTEHEISSSTMGYWMRKLGAEEQKTENEPVFAKLPSEQEIARTILPESSAPLSIFILKNIRIEVSNSCRPELLETLLKVLKHHA